MDENGRRPQETAVHALVLSGSGCSSTAAFEVGAMKALFEGRGAHLNGMGLDPAIYSGSAFGAFNAAVMASQIGGDTPATLQYLERAWLEDLCARSPDGGNGVYRLRGNPLPLFDPRAYAAQPTKPIVNAVNDFVFLSRNLLDRLGFFLGETKGPLLERLMHVPDLTPFFDMTPLQHQLRKHIHLKRLRQSDKELVVVATNWAKGRACVFTKQDMTDKKGHKILQGSATFLLTFPPVIINGTPFAGGPSSIATPLKPVCDIYGPQTQNLVIHVLDLLTPMEHLTRSEKMSMIAGFGHYFNMVEKINIHNDFEYESTNRNCIEENASARGEQTDSADGHSVTIHKYRPRKPLVNWFECITFDRQKAEERIEQGYRDTCTHDCEAEGCLLATPKEVTGIFAET